MGRGILLCAILTGLLFATAASAASVEPITVNPWKAGNAWFEANAALAKLVLDPAAIKYADKWDQADPDGDGPAKWTSGEVVLKPESGATITLTISGDNLSFDWESDYPVLFVVVKGGPAANIFYYEGGAYSDTELYAPTNPKNGKRYGLSHMSFGYNDPPEEEECWADETAWAYGARYVTRGNWAMYTEYAPGTTVNIYAGQTDLVGKATFSAVIDGEVTIKIALDEDVRFAKELDDDGNWVPVAENLKIQDYANAPSGNPNPGGFAWKSTWDGRNAEVTVPAALFYGIHLDVQVRM
jgi:hypothetical protein